MAVARRESRRAAVTPCPQQPNPIALPCPAAALRERADRLGVRPSMELKMSTTPTSPTQTDRIRALNDDLRQNISHGRGHAVMTTGIAALGAEAVARIIKTIEVYDDFCHANDPHEEHDFGSFEADGHTVFFKIDLYEDPDVKDADGEPLVNRVLTIMLAEEY
jgi:hypothetical protein